MTVKLYKIGTEWYYNYHLRKIRINIPNVLDALSKFLGKDVIYIKVKVVYTTNPIGFKFGFFYSHCSECWIASYTLNCFIQMVSPCCMEPLSIPEYIIPISRNLKQIIEITDIK